MITCTLGEKKYSVDFISGRALREMGPAWDMYTRVTKVASDALAGKASEEATTVAEAMDVLVKWFCILFGNQFGVEDVYDHYPVDRLMHDIVLSLLAVQSQTTEVLGEFPTMAAQDLTKVS